MSCRHQARQTDSQVTATFLLSWLAPGRLGHVGHRATSWGWVGVGGLTLREDGRAGEASNEDGDDPAHEGLDDDPVVEARAHILNQADADCGRGTWRGGGKGGRRRERLGGRERRVRAGEQPRAS